MFDVAEQGEWEYKSLISLNVTVPLHWFGVGANNGKEHKYYIPTITLQLPSTKYNNFTMLS
jgi:hypothetical protein